VRRGRDSNNANRAEPVAADVTMNVKPPST
jgi:hypothetical protein